jgi:hypothetical protein
MLHKQVLKDKFVVKYKLAKHTYKGIKDYVFILCNELI